MLQMLRSAATRLAAAIPANGNSAPRRASPYRTFLCYQDGRPFMEINAPSLEHARFIIAGFSADHTWMLSETEA